MGPAATVKVGRTDGGYCVRVEGRGTMAHSPAVCEFVERTLRPGVADARASVTVDLTACDYLDSTFLGCLLGLHQQFGPRPGVPGAAAAGGAEHHARFAVAATPEKAKTLFGPTRLDKLLRMTPTAPAVVGDWVPLPAGELPPAELSRHVMECHRTLAQVEGPNQAAFARIAEQMARDLGEKRG